MRANLALLPCILIGCLYGAVASAAMNDASAEVSWSYVGSTGPQHWGMLSPAFELCDTGKAQSPINIGRDKTRAPYKLKTNYRNAPLYIGEDLPIQLTIGSTELTTSLGHAIALAFHGKKPRETVSYQGDVYELVQIDFHSPSENLWHKQSYPLEIHFIHQGQHGKVLILAVFIKGGAANPALDNILQNLPRETQKEVKVAGAVINPAKLLPTDQRYYAFDGSLTSPPCTEGVQWVVMPNPITASPAQILEVRQATNGANARPVQPLGERVLSYAVQ